MPELPDITIYIEALESRIVGKPIEKIRLASPFLVRSVDPPVFDAEGTKIVALHRIGKRIVWELENELFLVFHLMVAGRFHWKKKGTKPAGKIGLAGFDFDSGTLMLTEASTKKRASLHATRGKGSLQQFNRGGIEIFESSVDEFTAALRKENHTLKRSLTDPTLFSGIGNSYSDEILHAAKLSPMKLTSKLSDEEIERLHTATQTTMREWIDRLRVQLEGQFPEKVTAFHDAMVVHGKFGEPCPVCGTKVQRIVYAENECNYCPRCQTGGKMLADRSLSRLLKDDWPRNIDEMEEKQIQH